MKATINRSLFRQFGGSTNSLSSSVVLCHPLIESGQYSGSVYKNDQFLGGFTVTCTDTLVDTQVDVDLSTFSSAGHSDCDCHGTSHYQVRTSGYLVFFSSKGEGGFHVELRPGEKRSDPSVYTTRKPVSGDVILCTLLRPGTYQLADSRNNTCTLTVNRPTSQKQGEAYKAEKQTLTLSERGFGSTSIQTAPTHPVVVVLETDSLVSVKLVEAYPFEKPAESPTKHRWQKQSPRKSA